MFAMTTPFEDGPEAEIAQGAALVGAFSDSGVPHVVFSSAADADKSTGIPHFDTKAALPRGGVAELRRLGRPVGVTSAESKWSTSSVSKWSTIGCSSGRCRHPNPEDEWVVATGGNRAR
ncbi:NmrA family NAD(P)-binding protein [Rhodococcus sp. 21391]|uniref:NmrA family NAD(P)-binding protein n=1 Tax=Rhodococcus sp. 21391 TaxID=2683591 RepID=UPI00211E514C|nr:MULTISPECIES: NmrA family NAD(P)-binding protein [Rhodococcus]